MNKRMNVQRDKNYKPPDILCMSGYIYRFGYFFIYMPHIKFQDLSISCFPAALMDSQMNGQTEWRKGPNQYVPSTSSKLGE